MTYEEACVKANMMNLLVSSTMVEPMWYVADCRLDIDDACVVMHKFIDGALRPSIMITDCVDTNNRPDYLKGL